MGHYFFIKSTDLDESGAAQNADTLIEWKSEVPPMFFPLFSGSPRYENSLLYCNAEEGLANLKKMYDFLEKHREAAFDKPEEFLFYKDKIIDYLDDSLQGFYELDGTDVFLTHCDEIDDVLLEESKNCHRLMQEVNSEIQKAIEHDDIEAFLSICTDTRISHRSAELRYFFNESVYQYGYACFDIHETSGDTLQFIEENGKVGLATEAGTVLLPPTYDEIFGFGDDEVFSVVRNGDKYGYINRSGKLVIPLIYDDAFDLVEDREWDASTETSKSRYRAVVKLSDRYGVIDEKNNIVLPITYEDVRTRDRNYSFPFMMLVTMDGKTAILDIDGKELHPCTIKKVHHEDDTDDDSGFSRFFSRLLIKTETETYYLNPSFKPYGHNVEIIRNGSVLPASNDVYCFMARNKEGKYGVIDWNNETLLPFEFDDVQELIHGERILYKAYKAGRPSLHLAANMKKTKMVIPPVYDDIGPILSRGTEWSYIVIEKDGKKGAFDFKAGKEALPPQFEAISFSHDEHNLFAFLNDKVIQFKVPDLKEVPLDMDRLETSIKYADEPDKKARAIFKKIKIAYAKKILEHIFNDPEEREAAQKRYPKVDFLKPDSIFDAAGKLEKVLEEAGSPIDDMQIFFHAYRYHFEKKTAGVRDLMWGVMNYLLAKMYYQQTNYPLAIEYAKTANTFIHANNILHVTVMEFICYTCYDIDRNEEAIQVGLSGLERIHAQRQHLKSGKAWVANIKKEYEMLDNAEETFNYYTGCSYFYQENSDYQKALEYIERSLTNKNDWNLYTKKYVRAISFYRTTDNLMDAFPLIAEVDELGKQYEANDDHCYIKYLMAVFYYHDFNDPQKALAKLNESLAINPEYELSLELKAEIEKDRKY